MRVNVSVERWWNDTDCENESACLSTTFSVRRVSLSRISQANVLLYTTNLFPKILFEILPRQ